MTEEQKAAIAAAAKAEKGEIDADEGKADAVDPAAEPIEGLKTDEADDEDLSQTDYEALLKAERERADAATKAAAELAFKNRNNKRKENGVADDGGADDGADDDDRPLTRREAMEFMSAQSAEIKKTAQESAALTIARANTATEAEAQAAVLFFKTRVIPTGNLEDDVLFAIGGINRKKAASKVVEMARTIKSKDTALHSTGNVHRDAAPGKEPKLSPQDAYAIKQSGMVWDGTLRLYKKALGARGAKHLYFDPKTKKRYTAA